MRADETVMMAAQRPIIKENVFYRRVMFRRLFFISVLLLAAAAAVTAQSVSGAGQGEDRMFSELPNGYSGISLGMEPDEVKQRLLESPDFSYRGEPDVSMLPRDRQELIDCDGTLFIDRAWFQFNEDRLYLIIMMLDREAVDHYSIFTSLSEKYGPPNSFSPEKAVWENDSVIISLERPLSVKYMDKEVFSRLQAESDAGEAVEAQLREEFLKTF